MWRIIDQLRLLINKNTNNLGLRYKNQNVNKNPSSGRISAVDPKKLADERHFILVTMHPDIELTFFEHAHDFKSRDSSIGRFH